MRTALRARTLLLLAALTAPGFRAGAETIVLGSTGFTAAGVGLADGAIDPRWLLTNSADATHPGPTLRVCNTGTYPNDGTWILNSTASKWVCIDADPNYGVPDGTYDFVRSFDLTGADPSTARLSGSFSSDNSSVLLVNGTSTGLTGTNEQFRSMAALSITNGALFVAGTNTFTLRVRNQGSGNPSGGRVENLTLTVTIRTPTVTAPTDGNESNVASPGLTGTAPAGSTVRVFVDGTAVGTVTATGAGTWSLASAALADGTHTVAARVVVGGVEGPSSNIPTFRIDTVAPETTVTGPASPTSAQNVRVNVSAADPTPSSGIAGFECTLDGLPFSPCVPDSAGQVQLNGLAPGSHTFTAAARDDAGNLDATAGSYTVVIDRTAPPTPTITSPADQSALSSSPTTLIGSTEPNATVTVGLDATLLCTTTADAQGAFSCPIATTLADGSHQATATARDEAGNSSLAAVSSFTVDTVAPSVSIASPVDGATLSATPAAVSGSAEAGSTVTVTLDGNPLCTATAASDGRWSCTVSTTLGDGSHTATARAVDRAGNASSTVQSSFSIDSTAPSAPEVRSPAAGEVTSDPTPGISGIAEPNSTVTVREGASTLCTATADSSGAWSCTPAVTLADGPHTVSAQARDPLGNVSATSVAVTFTVDTSAPAAPSITDPDDGDRLSVLRPTLSGGGEAGATVSVLVGGSPWCTATVGAAGSWSCTGSADLPEGLHAFTATQRDPAGNGSAEVGPVRVTLDRTAPAAPTVSAPLEGALLTSGTVPFSGTAEAGATVAVSEGSTELCRAVAAADGSWSCSSTTALAEGSHTVRAVATDVAGNDSPPSNERRFSIDSVRPAAPVLSSPASGSSTRDTTPTFVGTAEPLSSVRVFEGSQLLCTATADAQGAFSCDSTVVLADGIHTVTLDATDGAGNRSAPSAATPFAVDTTGPSSPAITSPAQGSVTTDTTPLVGGTADPGVTITVLIDGAAGCTAVADSNGLWSCALPTPLAEGSHALLATAVRSDGVTSAPAQSSFVVDTTPPTAPRITTPAEGEVTSSSTPTFVGTADPGNTVSVEQGGTVLCTAVVDAQGGWRCSPSLPLGPGDVTVLARATEPSGLRSASDPRHFIVDGTAPLTPSIETPAAGAVTPELRPQVTGRSEPGSTVTVTVDGQPLCTVVADASGRFACTPGFDLAAGAHRLTATATDGAGNSSATPAVVDFTVDPAALAPPRFLRPQEGELVADLTPALAGVADPGATVEVSLDGTLLCTVTAEADGSFVCTPTTPLAPGAAVHTATAVTVSGNSRSSAARVRFVTGSAALLRILGPTGSVAELQPPLHGDLAPSARPSGAVVVVWVDGREVCRAMPQGDEGLWSCRPTQPLTEGRHTAWAYLLDDVGQLTRSTDEVSFVIDLTAPAAPSVTRPADGDVTSRRPDFAGGGERGSTVTVRMNGAVVCTAVVDASGAWSCTPAADLPLGPALALATATDAAGNESPATAVSFTVGLEGLAAPTLIQPVNGASIDNARPTLGGDATPGATVVVSVDGVELCRVVATAGGSWSCTPASDLAEGPHAVALFATLGALQSATTRATFVVDLTPPGRPVVTQPSGVTSDPTPVVAGTVEGGAQTVTVTVGGSSYCEALVDSQGRFSCRGVTPLEDGPHTFEAVATDAAGLSGAEGTGSVTVDTTAPGRPSISSPVDGASALPATLTGSAEPGARVVVTVRGSNGDAVVCTTTADSSGQWSCTPSGPLPAGPAWTVAAVAIDAAGNASLAAQVSVFTPGSATTTSSSTSSSSASSSSGSSSSGSGSSTGSSSGSSASTGSSSGSSGGATSSVGSSSGSASAASSSSGGASGSSSGSGTSSSSASSSGSSTGSGSASGSTSGSTSGSSGSGSVSGSSGSGTSSSASAGSSGSASSSGSSGASSGSSSSGSGSTSSSTSGSGSSSGATGTIGGSDSSGSSGGGQLGDIEGGGLFGCSAGGGSLELLGLVAALSTLRRRRQG